jgi:OmpA-OmpF porin, OOP family
MKKIQSFALVCVGLISIASYTSSFAFAGNRPGALTVTLAGGYEYFSSKRLIDNTGLGIFMLGYDFTEHWGIEGLLGGFRNNFKGSAHDTRQINGTLFAIDGVYHFATSSMVEPYVLAGAGATGMNPSREDANNEGNVNAAVGLQLFVHKSVAFRLEARDLYTFVGGKNDVLLSGGVSMLFDLC